MSNEWFQIKKWERKDEKSTNFKDHTLAFMKGVQEYFYTNRK